jgi:hypothetical protein
MLGRRCEVNPGQACVAGRSHRREICNYPHRKRTRAFAAPQANVRMHEQRGGGMPKWEFRRFIRRTAVRLHGGARRSGCAPLVEISAVLPQPSLADEGGVSFRIPSFFGSLAATPLQPGSSFTTIYYHSSVKAGCCVRPPGSIRQHHGELHRQSECPNLNADVDLIIAVPSFTSRSWCSEDRRGRHPPAVLRPAPS